MKICYQIICPLHGNVRLSDEEYEQMLDRPDSPWLCPISGCARASEFDDKLFEASLEEEG